MILFSYTPTPERDGRPRRTYRPIRGSKPSDVWIAPEHSRAALSMKRDYPRNDWGEPIKDKGRFLVVDNRPAIMRPEKHSATVVFA